MKRGHIWQTDEHGVILNDASPEKIPEQYEPAIQAAIEVYMKNIPDDVHSIYVTGSVSRGTAVPNQSDLDIFAVLEYDVDPELVLQDWIEPAQIELGEKFPFLDSVALELWVQSWIFTEPEAFSIFGFIIKTHSVCVWGNDLAEELGNYRVPSALIGVANDDIVQMKSDIEEAIQAIEEDDSDDNVYYWSKRVSKNILRTGFGLVSMREGIYTRDVEVAYERFGKHYPEQEHAMKQALAWSSNPTESKGELLSYLNLFGQWMIAESDKWLDKYNPNRHMEYPLTDDADSTLDE